MLTLSVGRLHIPCHVSWGRAFARRPRREACGMSCVPCDGARCMSYRLSAGLIPLWPRATLKRLACGASAREWPTLSPGRHQDRTGHARTHARTHAHKTLGLLISRTVPCLRVSSRPSAPTHMPHHAHIYLPSTRQTKCARGSVGCLGIVWAAACCIGYCMGRSMLHWVLCGPQHVALCTLHASADCSGCAHCGHCGRPVLSRRAQHEHLPRWIGARPHRPTTCLPLPCCTLLQQLQHSAACCNTASACSSMLQHVVNVATAAGADRSRLPKLCLVASCGFQGLGDCHH